MQKKEGYTVSLDRTADRNATYIDHGVQAHTNGNKVFICTGKHVAILIRNAVVTASGSESRRTYSLN